MALGEGWGRLLAGRFAGGDEASDGLISLGPLSLVPLSLCPVPRYNGEVGDIVVGRITEVNLSFIPVVPGRRMVPGWRVSV